MTRTLARLQFVIWIFYIFTVSHLLYGDTRQFFLHGSPVSFYYFFLKAFDPVFYTKWTAHLAQIIVSWLHVMVLAFYVLNIQVQPRWIWMAALPLRLVLDIFGRDYELKIFKSLWKADPQAFWLVLGASAVIYIPSYIACYLYAYGSPAQRKL